MKTKGVAKLGRALGIMLFFFFLVSRLTAQQVIENSNKPLNKNAGRMLRLEPVFRITDQGGEWKGKIVTENGVKIIHNPKTPTLQKGIPSTVTLKEELTIGKDQDKPDLSFSSISSLSVDDSGNIFVVDGKDNKIKIYRGDGSFLRLIFDSWEATKKFRSHKINNLRPKKEIFP